MPNEIKNCPFCGGRPIMRVYSHRNPDGPGDKEFFRVNCMTCGVKQPTRKYYDRKEAVKMWNKRQ